MWVRLDVGVEWRRHTKDIGPISANCLVWKMAVASVTERNWRPIMCSKSWTTRFDNAETLAASVTAACFPFLPPVLEYSATTATTVGNSKSRLNGHRLTLSYHDYAFLGQDKSKITDPKRPDCRNTAVASFSVS
jgi:hypothetical protein